jgi:hypothetical protein
MFNPDNYQDRKSKEIAKMIKWAKDMSGQWPFCRQQSTKARKVGN